MTKIKESKNPTIKDVKDILDINKYLKKVEKDVKSLDHILGAGLLTLSQYISAAREIMFQNHLSHFVVLLNPEFPRLFTNYENIFGKLSSSIHKAKDDVVVHKIIPKFEWDPQHIYTIFFYDEKKNKYSCMTKKISEELTEKFGYTFNNSMLDSLEEGDSVKEGVTLYKSSSYDEYDNYCYGCNARILYLIDNRTIEDAVVVSESFAKRMSSKEVETIKITINDNDLLLNLYGDNEHHKGFPDIGEKIVSKVICAKRRIDNNQILYDLKNSNLNKYNPLNDTGFFSKCDRVIDINIYCNQKLEDIPRVSSNEQLIKYLENQRRYWQEIYDTCKEIQESGADYDKYSVGFMYGRAKNYLNPNYKWKDNDSVFSNMIIEISADVDVPLNIGYKITGRSGNKGVISKIERDENMPFTEDGVRVDVILNALGSINRLISEPLFEVDINFIADRFMQRIKQVETLEEKEELLWKFYSNFNERGMCDKLKKAYYALKTDERKLQFFDNLYEKGLHVNQPPISTSKESLFDVLKGIYQSCPWIKPYKVYVKKWGRTIQLMNELVVGSQYMFRLKQTAKKNFSVRSTGYLSQKGLPDKSNKSKHNQQLYSTTPIKIGRDENNNLSIGIHSYTLAKFHLFYRSSPAARREVRNLYTKNPLNIKKFKIKKNFNNRNVEILNAYFKSSGRVLDYGRTGLVIDVHDSKLHDFKYKKKMYLTSYKDMRNRLLEERWTKDFNKKLYVGTQDYIDECFDIYKHKEEARIHNKLYIDTRKTSKIK